MAESRTLYLLGLQYELAMLIGKGIVLEPMLKEFFPSALKRLACRSAYVWLDDGGASPRRLRYAYPRSERQRVESGGDLAEIAGEMPSRTISHISKEGRESYLHWYPLGNHGHCLIVRDRGPIDDEIRTALTPIMARLGDACAGCLEHEHAQAARASIAEKEKQFRETILENSVVGIAFLDASGRLIWANSAMAGMFCTTLHDKQGVSLEPYYVSRDDYLKVGGAVARAVAVGKTFTEEVRMRRADGSMFWVHLSGKAVNPSDLSRGTVWVVMDISKRRELEDRLRDKTAEQETILQSTQIGIAHTIVREHQWVNRTLAEMLGATSEGLIGKSLRNHFPDEAAFLALTKEADPIIARGEAYGGECLLQRADGDIFPVQIFIKAVDPADLSKGEIWTVMDLTEQHRLEGELQRTSRERELILKSTLVGIIYSRDRHNQWVNDAMANMLGYSADEMIGQSSRLQFPSDESWARFGTEAYPVLAVNGTFSAEWELAHRSGSPVWVHIIGKAVHPERPLEASIWTLVDITQRKQAEEDTRRALEQQQELNELKSRFVSMTSHEFRTPLATILSSSELLHLYGDRLSKEEQIDLFGSIKNAVKRMTQMLDNVLVIGRTDAGRLEFCPAPVSITPLCRELAEEAARTYAPGNTGIARLEFIADCPDERGMLDEKLLRHILGNLLSNAFKYSPQGGTVAFRVCRTDGTLRFTVQDSGIGIPPEDLARLFETFHRAKNVGNIQGTGLGMAIVKRAATLHGGSVNVESELGRGTTFTITLPWKAATA